MNNQKINSALDKVIVSASVSIVTLALANAWVYSGKPGLSLLPGAGGESDYRRTGVTDQSAKKNPTNPADFAVRPSQLGEGGKLPVLVAGFGVGGGTGSGLHAGIGGDGSAPGIESGESKGAGVAGDNGNAESGQAGGATAAVIASSAVVGAVASNTGKSKPATTTAAKSATVQRQAKAAPTKRTTKPAKATSHKPRKTKKAASKQMSTDAWCKHVLSERRNTNGCIAAGYRYTAPRAAHQPRKQAGILAANSWNQTAGQLTGSVTGNSAGTNPVKQLRRDVKAEVKQRTTPRKHTEKQVIAGINDTATPARTRREAVDTSAAEKAASNRKAAAAQSAKALQAQQEAAQRAAAVKAWKEKKAAEEQAKAKAEEQAAQARKAERLAYLQRKAEQEAAEIKRNQEHQAYLQRKAQREAEDKERMQARADWLKRKAAKEQAQAAQAAEQRRLDVKFCESLERKGQLHTQRAATCRTVYGFKAPAPKAPIPAPTAQARQAEKKAPTAKRATGLTKHEKDARYCESLKAPHLNRTCRLEHGYRAPKTAARKHVPVKQARPAKPKISKHDRDAAYCKTLNAPHTNRTCRIEHGYSAPKVAAKKHQPAKAAKVQRLERKVKEQSQAQKDKAYCKTLGGNAWKNSVCRNSYGFKKPAAKKQAARKPMNTKGKRKTKLWCGFDEAHNFEYKCRKDTNKDYYSWSE